MNSPRHFVGRTLLVIACLSLSRGVVEANQPSATAGAPAVRKSVQPTKLQAIAAEDNDFSTVADPSGQLLPVPKPVARQIHALVTDAYRRWNCTPKEQCFTPIRDFYGPIFRIVTPRHRYLYVFKRVAPLGASFYFLLLYDPATQRVTQQPRAIFGKWMEGGLDSLMQKPLVSFDDLDQDGAPEIVVEERVHNGTIYNAVVYHYYHVSADLSLLPVLALETNAIDLLKEKENGLVVRQITKLDPGHLRLDTFSEVREPTKLREKLGEVCLKSDGPGEPFQVQEHRFFDQRYSGGLVTLSGDTTDADENTFLRDGYTFYY